MNTLEYWTPSNIKKFRAKLQADHVVFARILGVNTRSVFRWETGCSVPSGTTKAVMNAILTTLEQNPRISDSIVKFIHHETQFGGLSGLIQKLFMRWEFVE